MTDQLIVNVTPFETRVALLEDGITAEVFIERHRGRGIVGNIYLAKVQRVLPGMQTSTPSFARATPPGRCCLWWALCNSVPSMPPT